eukprot:944191_1
MAALFPSVGTCSFVPHETMPLMYGRPSLDYTPLMSEDASVLSSHYRLVYEQWKMDQNDELLLSGYFRQCNFKSIHLPKEVQVIASIYYLKQYTEVELLKIIQSKQTDIANRRMDRKKRCVQLLFIGCSLIILVVFILIICSGYFRINYYKHK